MRGPFPMTEQIEKIHRCRPGRGNPIACYISRHQVTGLNEVWMAGSCLHRDGENFVHTAQRQTLHTDFVAFHEFLRQERRGRRLGRPIPGAPRRLR